MAWGDILELNYGEGRKEFQSQKMTNTWDLTGDGLNLYFSGGDAHAVDSYLDTHKELGELREILKN